MASDSEIVFHQDLNYMPRRKIDRGLFITMSAIIPSIAVWELHILAQYHLTYDLYVGFHVFLEFFLLFNIIGNLYYVKRVDSTGKHRCLPAILKSGWRYCHYCELNLPPRSYHCSACNVCILKRDRHCMFAGVCVGYYNQRYYILAVLYVWIGAFYSMVYQLQYAFQTLGGFSIGGFLKLVAPHMAVISGYLSIYGFIVTATQLILIVSTLAMGFLLIDVISGILKGQTHHEHKHNILKYNLGVYRNFLDVFGRQWYWAFFNPFCTSKIPGDGINFYTAEDLQEVKDV